MKLGVHEVSTNRTKDAEPLRLHASETSDEQIRFGVLRETAVPSG